MFPPNIENAFSALKKIPELSPLLLDMLSKLEFSCYKKRRVDTASIGITVKDSRCVVWAWVHVACSYVCAHWLLDAVAPPTPQVEILWPQGGGIMRWGLRVTTLWGWFLMAGISVLTNRTPGIYDTGKAPSRSKKEGPPWHLISWHLDPTLTATRAVRKTFAFKRRPMYGILLQQPEATDTVLKDQYPFSKSPPKSMTECLIICVTGGLHWCPHVYQSMCLAELQHQDQESQAGHDSVALSPAAGSRETQVHQQPASSLRFTE